MIQINENNCTRCGLCVRECPLGLIVSETGAVPRPGDRIEHCIACGHCVAICPGAAISLPEDFGPAREFDNTAPAMLELIRRRRSIRRFQKMDVDRQILERILDALAYAPSARNGRPVHLTIIQGADRVKALSEKIAGWLGTKGGFYASFAKLWAKGIDAINCSAPCVIIASTDPECMVPQVDSAIALTTFELAASSHGLGTCWAGITALAMNEHPEAAALAGIPEGHRVWAAMMVGHPAVEYRRLPPRKPVSVTWS